MQVFCKRTSLILFFLFSIVKPEGGSAEVYFAQDEALKIAFPDADFVEKKTFVLSSEQMFSFSTKSASGNAISELRPVRNILQHFRPLA